MRNTKFSCALTDWLNLGWRFAKCRVLESLSAGLQHPMASVTRVSQGQGSHLRLHYALSRRVWCMMWNEQNNNLCVQGNAKLMKIQKALMLKRHTNSLTEIYNAANSFKIIVVWIFCLLCTAIKILLNWKTDVKLIFPFWKKIRKYTSCSI